MKQRSRVRIAAVEQKMEWRVMSVLNADPTQFASELQAAFQELTDAGYTLLNQMHRGDGLIITAHRIATSTAPKLDAPTLPAPALTKDRRRIVDMPARPTSETRDEVLYNFLESREQRQEVCADMPYALRLLREHLERDDILPISITTVAVTTTTFEPSAFPMLLKTFAEDLCDDSG